MTLVGSMAYSDILVQTALFELIDKLGSDAVISQSLISETSGIPLTTVQYALRRLIKSGHVISDFETGVGYRYRRPDGSTSSAQKAQGARSSATG